MYGMKTEDSYHKNNNESTSKASHSQHIYIAKRCLSPVVDEELRLGLKVPYKRDEESILVSNIAELASLCSSFYKR